MSPNDVMLTARQVYARYGGISEMTLWRWLRDDRMNFPQPMIINGRRYWKFADLVQWEITRASNREAA